MAGHVLLLCPGWLQSLQILFVLGGGRLGEPGGLEGGLGDVLRVDRGSGVHCQLARCGRGTDGSGHGGHVLSWSS